MKSKFQRNIVAVAIYAGIAMFAPPSSAALIWYWGANPNETFTASFSSPTNRAWLPFTVVANGEELVGGSTGSPLLDGVQKWDTAGYRIDSNMGGYWGIYNGTNLINTGLGIANLPGTTDDVPEGVYTSDSLSPTMLNYWAAGDSNHQTLLSVGSLNSYRVTVGEPAQGTIPEPTTLLLTGLGLFGLGALRRRVVNPPAVG